MLRDKSSDYGYLVGIFRGYGSPIVAVLGLIGNIFIIILFGQEKPRTRFSIYAISLAISNEIALITNTIIDDFLGRGLYYITKHKYYYKLDATSQFFCKLVEYVSNSMYFISSYLIVLFTFDRLLTINKPIKFYSIYHKRWAIGTCLITFLLGIILNIPLLFVQTLVIDNDSRTNFTCRMIEEYSLSKFTITFEVICTFTIPFFLVFIMNSLIVFHLWRLKKTHTILVPSDCVKNYLEMGRVAGHLGLSTVFLLLYMPMVCLVLIRLNLTMIHMDRHSPYALNIIDLSRLFSSMKDITYAVNFFLYLIFLKNFRLRFLNLFKCKIFERKIQNTNFKTFSTNKSTSNIISTVSIGTGAITTTDTITTCTSTMSTDTDAKTEKNSK